jgi:hypothetical protein
MTATREAIVLPMLFLTVALLGGLRIAGRVALVVPPLVAVVLGLLLVGAMVRAGLVLPGRLVNRDRGALENASGAMVMLTLAAASAQVFHLVIPDTGLLHLLFAAFFFLELLTTIAGVSGPRQLLRSLGVLFAGAFVLRWIVLENLYAPGTGTAKRMLTLLLEGISVGAIDYRASSPATGYVALLAIVLFLTGLFLLTVVRRDSVEIAVAPPRRGDLVALFLAAALVASACGKSPAKEDRDPAPSEKAQAERLRDDALRAAHVWHKPAIPVRLANLAANPDGRFARDGEVSCRFVPKKVGGTSPKFDCELPDGKALRVKYGANNPELHAEVAATRLLGALGFPTDSMYVVGRVHCLGCPQFPFQALKCLDDTGLESACFTGGIDYSRATDFDHAVVEVRHEGVKVEAFKDQGWAWFELDSIDPARGGSPRAEVDALRLTAMLLAHWDNKAENQRLVCTSGNPDAHGCRASVALIQDLGATFGPRKLDLENWRRTPIWRDARNCTVSMETLPYQGGTFPARQISEAGRQLLLGLVEQLTDQQLEELFTASRITSYDQVSAAARRPGAWVEAFKEKVKQIRDAGPCAGG